MELQNIQENCQATQRRRVEFTSLEQEVNVDKESWIERANIHLERNLEKGINEKNMLRNLSYYYLSRNMVCQARIRSLKAKLKRAWRRQKEHEGLQILAKASLAQHNAWWRRLSPNFKKFGALFVFLKILAHKSGFSALCAAPRGAHFF